MTALLASIQSARALMDSLLNDHVYTVSRVALGVYVKHPRRHEIDKDQEDVILR